MSLPEMVTDLQMCEPGVTIEQFLEALYGIRTGAAGPVVQPVADRYVFGAELRPWLRLWGLDGGDDG